ncbi:hypothetical protein FEG63_02695 [Mycolicibacterium sphagni]|uniref:Uncharacterized protein n=1 Tax=Mycolicibacterium sphagni TaxID=1786 RepID=A0ABX2JSJ4_9MYCO|nr:hypothetical protein [Mycolicibacterium sphagni]NTY58460.1 hypothetical protein [Mycolicibacterium sphagni]
MSIRATTRVTGAAKNTITNLLVDLGGACSGYQAAAFYDLPCKTIQCDEIWSAICAYTKLVPSWLVGERTADDARVFIRDLASRLENRVQLTSDGLKLYVSAVEPAFAGDIDYAMLHKLYDQPDLADNERRYSPAICTGYEIRTINGTTSLAPVASSS